MRTIVLLLTAAVLGACGDSTGPDRDAILGLYSLESYDGRSIPALLDDTSSVQLTDGSVEFEAASECTLFIEVTDAGEAFALFAPCTYELNGSNLVVNVDDAYGGEQLTGTWSRTEVTITDPDGVEWVFRRQ